VTATTGLGGWVLRALVAVLPPLAALATIGAGEAPPVWFVAVILLLSVAFAAYPESAVGVVVLTLVVAWWGIGLRDGLHAWALAAAAALLVTHLAAVLVSYGPAELPVEPGLVTLWARRAALVFLASPALLAAGLWLRDQPDPPGMWVWGLAAAFSATMVASVVYSRTRGD
jgi:hypothetical protein